MKLGVPPKIDYVFGDISGLIPGYKLDFIWSKFDFYPESEYVVDVAGEENNYFYTWSELATTPFENFRTRISANRTRLYNSSIDLQRGVLYNIHFGNLLPDFTILTRLQLIVL